MRFISYSAATHCIDCHNEERIPGGGGVSANPPIHFRILWESSGSRAKDDGWVFMNRLCCREIGGNKFVFQILIMRADSKLAVKWISGRIKNEGDKV